MRIGLAIVFVIASACGPDVGAEPEVVSVACATDEPIALSEHPGSHHWLAWAGRDWSMLSGAYDTVVVEPCGGGDVQFYAGARSRPFADGRLVCAGALASWAEDREAVPVPLVETDFCEHAVGTPFGVFVEAAERRLLWFASPEAAPVELTDRLVWARDFPPRASAINDALWVVDDRAIWFVAGDNVLERVELGTGARETIAARVVSVGLTADRRAVVWSTLDEDLESGATTVHVAATGEQRTLRGPAADLRWRGLVVTTDGYQLGDVLDLDTGVVHELRVPSGGPLRAVQGEGHVLWLGIYATAVSEYAIFRVGFDGTFDVLAGISPAAQIAVDPHGDGLLVIEAPVDERPGEPPLEHGGMMRVSPTTGVEVLFDEPIFAFALASDDRVLYSTRTFDAPAEQGDLRVRNPDGSDRLFAANAELAAPVHFWSSIADPMRNPTPPELEGDVLVNVRDGATSRLWRMPFDATR